MAWRSLHVVFLLNVCCAAAAESFSFAAIGCVPYARVSDSRDSFLRLVVEINRYNPAFVVHLGDMIGSDERPSDELLLKRRSDFDTFVGPLIYTPGDNEWTDTHSKKVGGYDPLERLTKLRELFFSRESSFGQKPIDLITQRRDPRFGKFVENSRWRIGGIIFATVHLVGSSNNNQPAIPGAMAEWRERDAANESWLRLAFAEARATNAPGLVLFFHANPFASDRGRMGYARGYERFLKVAEEESREFAKPVLFVHADEHRYRLDVGIRFQAGSDRVSNVTRLETFGEQNIHGCLVTVDPASKEVFLCGPIIVPGNRLPQLPRPQS